MEVLAIIPARSGSKSVVDKNIRKMAGKPMLAYSIEQALSCELINRVIVSTDSEKYAEIARQYGAETPFLRPDNISGDASLDIDTFMHALNYLSLNENYVPDIVVHLRPTYPIRDIRDICNMINLLENNPDADSVRCIAPAKEVAYKMWRLDGEGYLKPILDDIPEAYNMPRQQLPKIYMQNACIDVVRGSTIVNQQSMSGKKIIGYEMKHNFDIDTEEDFMVAEQYLMKKEISKLTGKRFVFDIDGVIAKYREDLSYEKAEPNYDTINVINKLYEQGNTIVLFTARGYASGNDWRDVTETQMKRWGVKYNELLFGKPNADFYIDDKMLSLAQLKRLFS